MYRNTGEYSKALTLYESALTILQSSLPSNHPHLQSVQHNIEIVTSHQFAIKRSTEKVTSINFRKIEYKNKGPSLVPRIPT
jgi:hypothetical protein